MVAFAPGSAFAGALGGCATEGAAPNTSVAPAESVGFDRGLTVPAAVRAGGGVLSGAVALNIIVRPAASSPKGATAEPTDPAPAVFADPGAGFCAGAEARAGAAGG